MTKILFIGDKPSRKNKNPDVAFEGTRSGVVLDQWVQEIGIDPKRQYRINSDDDFRLRRALRYSTQRNVLIVPLGQVALKRVDKIIKEEALDLTVYPLPHPSPRNRKLNDPNFIVRKLDDIRLLLDGRVVNVL